MAPVPKKRQTKASQRKRRAVMKLRLPNLRPCPVCGKPKQSHRICPECGDYGKKIKDRG